MMDVEMQETSEAVVKRLSETICAELDALDDGQPFSLVDFPDHGNVGDSAIWLGEIAYFGFSNRFPNFVCGSGDANVAILARAKDASTIYIHGGGNFGDFWPQHQEFRNNLLRNCKHRRVVQLPQSVYFSKAENLDATKRAIEDHGNFTLLVRDNESLELAQKSFDCRSILCPDMAYSIGTIQRPTPAKYRELYLMRADHEKSSEIDVDLPTSDPESVVADWLDEPHNLREVERRKAILMSVYKGTIFNRDRLMFDYYVRLASNRFRRGLSLLSSAEHVTTDRLHAHILCTLLNIPNKPLDNSYGKISRFISAWNTNWSA